jgi:hypothetical protein
MASIERTAAGRTRRPTTDDATTAGDRDRRPRGRFFRVRGDRPEVLPGYPPAIGVAISIRSPGRIIVS